MLAPNLNAAAATPEVEVIAHRRTLWRWHFYAALFVMPLLLVLAITGTIYCFQPQIEPLLYRDRMVVAESHGPQLSRDVLLAKAAASEPRGAVPTLAQIEADRTRSAEFVFRLPSGESESVYVNPYDGAVLGTLSVEHRLMKQVRNLHRGLMLLSRKREPPRLRLASRRRGGRTGSSRVNRYGRPERARASLPRNHAAKHACSNPRASRAGRTALRARRP